MDTGGIKGMHFIRNSGDVYKRQVLDVGCGGGANIVAWLGKCGNGHVTGMAVSYTHLFPKRRPIS